jgi:hypothetical protein
MLMQTPADRTAKRISSEEWFARYDGAPSVQRDKQNARALQRLLAPADRVAVRT